MTFDESDVKEKVFLGNDGPTKIEVEHIPTGYQIEAALTGDTFHKVRNGVWDQLENLVRTEAGEFEDGQMV